MIARSPEALVAQEFRRGQLRWRREGMKPRSLAVALSRRVGARGDEVARSRIGDPEDVDLVVNTHVLDVEGAVDAIKGALSRVAVHGEGA